GPAAELLPRLAADLGHADGGVRREAINYIIRLELPASVPLLLKCAHDTNGDVRIEAARGLSMFDSPELASGLAKLLPDPDQNVVETAENALARLKVQRTRR